MDQLARYLRVLTWAAVVLVLSVPLVTWREGVTVLTTAVSLPPFLIVAWGLLQLSGFYNQVSRGLQFTSSAAAALRRFGRALITASLILLPCRALAALIGPEVDALDALLLRPGPLLATALGAILGSITAVFAKILDHATELAEENASFL